MNGLDAKINGHEILILPVDPAGQVAEPFGLDSLIKGIKGAEGDGIIPQGSQQVGA
jgi:hypothetical protein